MLEQKNKEKKMSMEGQMTMFDLVGEEDKQDFQITFPKVEEFDKEDLLAFEKETLGIYISGHPLEAYEKSWRANITAMATDFIVEEETEAAKVADGANVIIGGMITAKTVKTTRNNKMMAFVTLEDLAGTVEVIVFPKDYEKKRDLLAEDARIFVQGRASIGEDPVGKVICERIIPFDQLPRQLWLQFANKAAYTTLEPQVMECLRESEGADQVVLYLAEEKGKENPACQLECEQAVPELLEKLEHLLGEKNVKVVEKTIEKMGKMN